MENPGPPKMSFYQKIKYGHYEISSLCLNEMIRQKSTKESLFSRIHFGKSFLARVSLLLDFCRIISFEHRLDVVLSSILDSNRQVSPTMHHPTILELTSNFSKRSGATLNEKPQ